MLWKVPHFEKMMYDNGQLVSLYSEAYDLTKKELYLDVVRETLEWTSREMTSPEGAFYSALDADSEGEEGKFYVWKKEELENILREDFTWFADLYSVNSIGYWEEENYIPLMRESLSAVATKHGMTIKALREKVVKAKQLLLSERSRRVRPGLDDKILTSWNALMLHGYVDAWKITEDAEYLLAAKKNAKFIAEKMTKPDGTLWHTYKNGVSTVNGFLEDYAFVIDAYIALYQTDFDEQWLLKAKELCTVVLDKFYDEASPLLYFTSSDDPKLIARKHEVSDNVIPASNSAMARNLFYLGKYFGNPQWLDKSAEMLKSVEDEMLSYGPGYSNWLILALHRLYPSREVVIVGKAVDKTAAALRKHYLPNEIFAGSTGHSTVPVLQNRILEGQTPVYVCENNTCHLPVFKVEEIIAQLVPANPGV
ncbi:MAG TPA: thioredoxin domain-containing protein, partial [Bacteroidia bacterium]|nr:thioredoxin domain-containing protein [Bacteroidia bacterium]